MIKGIYTVEHQCIFWMKKLEAIYMCDYLQGTEGISYKFNTEHYEKHELKSGLPWIYSLTDLCATERWSAWCTAGVPQLSSHPFNVSHVQRNMSIDLGH